MAVEIMPVSAIVATRHRPNSFLTTLESLARQASQPAQIVVVDASDDLETRALCEKGVAGLQSQILWLKASRAGAAAQRNQGVERSIHSFVWFFDDDIRFEADCVRRLWHAIEFDRGLGGVNAMIVNQRYQRPGFVSRAVFTAMNGRAEQSYAGRLIGPAINLLPEDRDDLPSIVPVDWLNTTCTIYRREAFPSPVFDSFFEGYSLMEDVTLSLRVGKTWRLANVRDARIFHDSQPGDHKANHREIAKMELVNRHYVMREILNQRGLLPFVRLGLWQAFQLASVAARSSTRSKAVPILLGQADAIKAIILREGP
jgi:GT2 family glycosyltransferase